MTSILQVDAPILREKARGVPENLFGTKKLARMIADMGEALDRERDGVALAAPQIGLPYRIFIVRYDRTLPIEEGAAPPEARVGVYINPKIVKKSRRTEEMDEGCLSVRGIYGKTYRYNRTTVRAQDENGVTFVRGGGGLLAQIFQHETDHLEGILFTDHAIDLYEFYPDETEISYDKKHTT